MLQRKINIQQPPSVDDGLLKVKANIVVRDMISKKRILGNSWADTVVLKALTIGQQHSMSTYNPFVGVKYDGIDESLLMRMAEAFTLGASS